MPRYISGMSNSDGTLPEADYPFKIVSAKLRNSKKSGAEMIECQHEVSNGNGNSVRVMDWLVFDGGTFTSARIDQIRKSIGEIILPEEDIMVNPSDLLHKTGRLHLITDTWNNKKINRVGSYLEPEEPEDEIPGLTPEPKKKTKQPF